MYEINGTSMKLSTVDKYEINGTKFKYEMDKVQNQLATGQRISRPGDDPSAATNQMYYRSRVNELEQFAQRAIPHLPTWHITGPQISLIANSCKAVRYRKHGENVFLKFRAFFFALYGSWEVRNSIKRLSWGVGVFSTIEYFILRTFIFRLFLTISRPSQPDVPKCPPK